jgi:hypothetical protein
MNAERGGTGDVNPSLDPETTAPDRGSQLVRSRGAETARSACRALASFGRSVGWGLTILGLFAAFLFVAESAAARVLTPAEWAISLSRAGALVMACGLAGWGVSVLFRATGAAILEYLEQVSHGSDELATQSARAIALLERIAQALEARGEFARREVATDIHQSRYFEIERAIKGAHWAEAGSLLDQFELDYPPNPKSAALREEMVAARQGDIQERLAQLEAARDVNDPDRVLELYQGLAPSLAAEVRAPLQQKLAPWFLSLIHRRLRIGKIQADVVLLAGRFAETFATTHEGASVRASLPTLRRSIGLCPRCAQPYTGLGAACPKCLGIVTPLPDREDNAEESTEPE